MASLTHLLSRRGEFLILILLLVLSGTLMLLSSSRKESFTRTITDAAVTPVQSVLTSGDELVGLRKENAKLRIDLSRSTLQIAELKESADENERLRTMLEIRGASANRLVAARVVAREATRDGRELKIDKGTQDGIRPDQCVITADGLVGKVTRVAPRSAFVRPLLARNCRVSSRLSRSRDEGILAWHGGATAVLEFLPFRADAKEGDDVVTSGLGGIFPRGIPVGQVFAVSTNPKDGSSRVEVAPAVKFTAIEEVFVVQGEVPFDGEVSPEDPAETREG